MWPQNPELGLSKRKHVLIYFIYPEIQTLGFGLSVSVTISS